MDSAIYLLIGDEKILKCDLETLNFMETIGYDKFIHNDTLCCNTITMLNYDEKEKILSSFLCYFPTIDSEK